MHTSYTHLPDEEMNLILNNIRVFMKERIIPIELFVLNCAWSDALPQLESLRKDVKTMGYWLPQISKEFGGMGLSTKDFGKVSEVLGGSPLGHYAFNCQAPDAGNMELLIEFGTDQQKELYLEPLLEGKIRSCFSMTEPDFAGSDPILMGTTALKDENGYIINGRKWFTSSADGAHFAIVMALTQAESNNPYKRAGMLIVPCDTQGFFITRNISVMGDRGEGYFSHAEIVYDQCSVPIENLLGPEDEGFKLAQSRLGPGRIHHCMRWIGICERAFDLMCSRAVSRKTADGKSLSAKQSIQHWIAESRAEINASRFMVLDAADKIDKIGYQGAKTEISVIKFFVANVLQRVLDRAIQVHGALGITDDSILSWWYRHERGARIYDGPDEVHKSRAAKEILKAYIT